MKNILSFAKLFVIALILAVLLNNFVVANATIPTDSMETTVMVGDRIIANRLAYKSSDPKRGDIVIFMPPDGEDVPFLKRIIGLPGETIEGKNNKVYINGKALEESYLDDDQVQDDFGPFTIPEGSYFMMGDNRIDSYDARYWDNKFVKKEDIMKDMKKEAETRVKYRYLLEAIVKAEKIEISEKDAKAELKKMAEDYKMTEEDLLKEFNNSLEVLKYDLAMRKAIEVLKENN